MNSNVINDLLNYNNIKIIQNKDMFAFSLDSVLLANFVKINLRTKNILDIGTGNAPIPLILSTKTKASITGVEIQQDVFELAKQSIEINNKINQIKIINEDINILYKKIPSDYYDIITCNPPFFKINENNKKGNSIYKQIARHEIKLNLEQLMIISKKILKNNASINIVHRPNRLLDIIFEMKKNNIEPKRIQFIYPKIDSEANMILIEGIKNGNSGLIVEPPLYVHEEDGKYTKEILKIFQMG
ncbi:MAG: tRNA1(Val) (adenine(37)-N6)-methyltransferase [Bacilli bacterium]|nr:tRNA1(Val) (adenine(37)-N6)-methyltransferase [Bacilli bacterium]